QLIFGDEAAVERRLADGDAGILRLVEDFPELIVVDVAEIDEDLAELATAGGAARRGALGGNRGFLGRLAVGGLGFVFRGAGFVGGGFIAVFARGFGALFELAHGGRGLDPVGGLSGLGRLAAGRLAAGGFARSRALRFGRL